ncbi:MAG: DUF3052 domain-containing protein [Gammaproteobacteria bacterium]|nr:DUF3052 domain-containing protein [Gammaproteobacteria bacterium]MDH5653431.1 DUF3052 domain-containing protein [Gammaproteobacteria bacterium]
MAGYSGTPLAKKLGIKEGQRIYIKNSPCIDYKNLFDEFPANVQILKKAGANLDLIHFFTKSRSELDAEIRKFIEKIRPAGMIWISWPKKSAKIPTDVTEDVIREVILPLGLVDIKVCAVNDIWSGLKLVIRKENRK